MTDVLERDATDSIVHLRYEAAPPDGNPLSWMASVACRAEAGVEEPWLFPLHQLAGGRVRHGWRWPAVLATGVIVGGVATISSADPDEAPLEIERTHHVQRRETVSVPAGELEAWLVTFDETLGYDGLTESSTGRLWLAEDVGLVRFEQVGENGTYEMALIDHD